MPTAATLEHLETLITSQYTFLYLTTWEEQRWESKLADVALAVGRGVVTWSVTAGPQPPLEGRQAADRNVCPSEERGRGPGGETRATAAALRFLDDIPRYPPEHVFVLKDFHPLLRDAVVVRKLRDLAPLLVEQSKTVVFFGPVLEVPVELEKDLVHVDLPLPDLDDLKPVLAEVLARHARQNGRRIEPTESESERLIRASLGLSESEARRALSRALAGKTAIDDDVYAAIVSEKSRLIRGSDLLQFYELAEGVQDIGGLDLLKEWLATRADAFSERARRENLPMPKGALLLGVQGCGKSLTSRAAARLLSFPLVRMDVANLLAGQRGSSEKNMRDALKIVESIAPVVLWLDEIEKGFAGLEGGSEGSAAMLDATMSRLFGTFVTWMQERTEPVFVIATANSVTNLPPELLRRGRFDELFFIDLPNYYERKAVFRVHLRKRGLDLGAYDLDELAAQTDRYSGAEIEQIVISAMYEAFAHSRKPTQHDILEARDTMVPLSVTMEEKVFELREWARNRCRPATPDSRVLQMIDEENRAGAERR